MNKNPELTMILPVINRVFPEMKILCALRDPRDVCLSCFMQPLPMNSVSVNYLSIESTFKKYATTMQTWLTLRPILSCDWMPATRLRTLPWMDQRPRPTRTHGGTHFW